MNFKEINVKLDNIVDVNLFNNVDINLSKEINVNLNNGFIFLLVSILILSIIILLNNCNYYYNCNNYLINSYLYLLLYTVLYSVLIICIINFAQQTNTYKLLKYYYDNYYVLWMFLIVFLLLVCGFLFNIFEDDIFYSHMLWLIIIFLFSILSIPYYKDLSNINLLVNSVINKIIITIVVMLFVILYKDMFREYIDDQNYISISIIIIIISLILREKIMKNSDEKDFYKRFTSYILLLVFTCNLLISSDNILENTDNCNTILKNVKLNDDLYYPNYCKLSIDLLLKIVKIINDNLNIN